MGPRFRSRSPRVPGAKSVLYRYRPLSGQFVRERMSELRATEGYVSVLLTLSKVEATSAYLRVLGRDIRTDLRARSLRRGPA